MPNQFCKYLSNGYSFTITKNNSIEVKPCCLHNNSVALDSELLKNRNLKFNSIDNWTSACAKCKIIEDSGQLSLRQSSFDWIDNIDSQDPVCIDINLDFECNAACVTCNEFCSSLWKKEKLKLENKKIKIASNNSVINAINNIVDVVSLEKVKYIKFFGGEPLFTDTHLKFLQHLPHPENVTLHYTTNGSIYPNQLTQDAWAKFKTVIFAASLDGINEQFDYVRWPLPWRKVSENILRLKNDNKSNIMFRVEFTANFLNTYYFDRLEQWVNTNLASNLSGDPTEINIHQCWGGTWDLDLMPTDIRHTIMEKYPQNHRIHRLVANSPPPRSLDPWKKFIETWDTRRGNDWKIAFPDLVQYL